MELTLPSFCSTRPSIWGCRCGGLSRQRQISLCLVWAEGAGNLAGDLYLKGSSFVLGTLKSPCKQQSTSTEQHINEVRSAFCKLGRSGRWNWVSGNHPWAMSAELNAVLLTGGVLPTSFPFSDMDCCVPVADLPHPCPPEEPAPSLMPPDLCPCSISFFLATLNSLFFFPSSLKTKMSPEYLPVGVRP